MAGDGRLDAVFYDRRRDPDNTLTDVFLASSTDAGRTFRANARVNSRAFSSQIGARYAVPSAQGLVEFGSGLALRSEPGRALAAWTDTRNADDPRHQDIFATTVTYPAASAAAGDPSRDGDWMAGGLAAAVAAGGLGWWVGRRARSGQ